MTQMRLKMCERWWFWIVKAAKSLKQRRTTTETVWDIFCTEFSETLEIIINYGRLDEDGEVGEAHTRDGRSERER